ncbi:hypothetical protein [Natronoglycomyces albus]|uniref:Uncharacterized protein n=1 Tax=Natronoglycomyces albus TaxID=2811108 RepID=A0A895XKJ8_9ACTN|nr:hypothetical protein [Natronoglycomyces albus]QSB04083.1 hypothetical protein JQS30_09655 [Natronoglycomyces albus]
MSAHAMHEELDLDVQDVSNGDWDALVADILENAGDLTPHDPDVSTISGCCASSVRCGC